MTDREKQLLEHALDALDRLFDGQASAYDIWALLLATGEALHETPHHLIFKQMTSAMLEVVRSGTTAVAQRDQALVVTDELRHYLAALLDYE